VKIGIETYYGGIWSFLETNEDHEHYMFGSRMIARNYTADELDDYLSDIEVLQDYPLPTIRTAKPLLHFISWEEHVKTIDSSAIPEEVPKTWLPWNINDFESFVDRDFLADFPLSGYAKISFDFSIFMGQLLHVSQIVSPAIGAMPLSMKRDTIVYFVQVKCSLTSALPIG